MDEAGLTELSHMWPDRPLDDRYVALTTPHLQPEVPVRFPAVQTTGVVLFFSTTLSFSSWLLLFTCIFVSLQVWPPH